MQKIIIGEYDVDTEDSGTALIMWINDPLDNSETGKHKEFHDLFDRYKTIKVTIEGLM